MFAGERKSSSLQKRIIKNIKRRKTREMQTKSKKGRSARKLPFPPIIPSPTESQAKKMLQEGEEAITPNEENEGGVLQEELAYSSPSSEEQNLDSNQVEKVFVNFRGQLNAFRTMKNELWKVV